MKLYDRTYFEGRNSNYWWTIGNYENFRCFPHWEEILRLIQEFKKSGKLLDIGCAYGLLVSAASKHFESYGIDISNFAVKKSKRYCKGNISLASAINLPFKNKSFDVVTIVDTLEHVAHLTLCLKEIRRILKNDGIVFLQLPNPLIWTHVCAYIGLVDESHMNDFGLKQWETLLTGIGFRIKKHFGMVAYNRKIRFFAKSQRAASLFPELWMIAEK